MKKIYVVYSQTHTILATLIKFFTKEEYSHVSISLDSSCKNMYSFGRRHYWNPFIGTFVKENIKEGLFKLKKKTDIRVYSVNVTQKQYKNILNIIKQYRKNNNKYSYNFLGLIYTELGIKKIRKNKLYCAEFVYDVLSDKKVGLLNETNKPILINSTYDEQKYELYYEGKAINYM